MRSSAIFLPLAILCMAVAGHTRSARSEQRGAEGVRVVVIGGMVETGFWAALTERFEKSTGHRVELVASGPKFPIAEAFRAGKADLVTMHASDVIINLVADGYATDPQPWLKNDMVIVGPADDPAGIRGLSDAGAALGKIRDSGSTFVIHASLGTQEVLRSILNASQVVLAPSKIVTVIEDQSRRVLDIAAEKHAYTMVGRIPFLSGKMVNSGLVLMVRGDPHLRRPYVVAVANPARLPHANARGARELASYLRQPETQKWIAQYGQGKLDEHPLFFPVYPFESDSD